MLPFVGGGSFLVEYDLDYNEHNYYVRYKYGRLSVERDELTGHAEVVLEQTLADANGYDGWSDEETTVYLGLISDAIRNDGFAGLNLLTIRGAPNHPYYRKGPLPLYSFGPVCGKDQAPFPPGSKENSCDRRRRRKQGFHDHSHRCWVTVPTCEREAYAQAHPEHGLGYR